jgi:hypothetical protein
MTSAFAILILIIVVALIFDFINGFHDAANSIATVVSTRVLSPGRAVVWAAFFNFVAGPPRPRAPVRRINGARGAPHGVLRAR